MKDFKKKLLAGGIALGLIISGCMAMSSGGPDDPPPQGSNTQITETFHC